MFFSSFKGYWYHFPIESLLFFLLNIGPDTPIYISCYSDSVSWWLQKSIKMINLHEYEDFPQLFLLIFKASIPLFHRNSFLFVNIGRVTPIFISNYPDSVSSWSQYIENESSSINVRKYHNIFLLSSKVWILLYHKIFDIFLWLHIDSDILIYISLTNIECLSYHKIVKNG